MENIFIFCYSAYFSWMMFSIFFIIFVSSLLCFLGKLWHVVSTVRIRKKKKWKQNYNSVIIGPLWMSVILTETTYTRYALPKANGWFAREQRRRSSKTKSRSISKLISSGTSAVIQSTFARNNDNNVLSAAWHCNAPLFPEIMNTNI
jgi:hypothetical protein